MATFTYKEKTYNVESDGFLLDPSEWDEDYAEGAAAEMGLQSGLSEEHWRVIRYVRSMFELTGRCPLIYETCKANRLRLSDLRRLFPRGYLRGPCRLAGVTYRESVIQRWPTQAIEEARPAARDKVYRIDALGFLVDPAEWDEEFAQRRADDLKMRGGLSERHWEVIRRLREAFAETGVVPTVYETCDAHGFGLDALESLFPDGYHRGVVRLAGLRLR